MRTNPTVNTRPSRAVLQTEMMSGEGSSLAEITVDSCFTIRDCRAVTGPPLAESAGDSSLVLAARAGDRDAFGALYDRYARMVHGILLARVPASDVDDLVQDVFLRALPKLCDLRDAARFGPWLAAITRNRANDYHRQSRTVATPTESLSEDEVDLPALETHRGEEAAAILAIVRSLSETYRETLIHRLVEGMTGPEIAVRTGMTPGSVRVNLHRGMQQLRERLDGASFGSAIQRASAVDKGSTTPGKISPGKRNEP